MYSEIFGDQWSVVSSLINANSQETKCIVKINNFPIENVYIQKQMTDLLSYCSSLQIHLNCEKKVHNQHLLTGRYFESNFLSQGHNIRFVTVHFHGPCPVMDNFVLCKHSFSHENGFRLGEQNTTPPPIPSRNTSTTPSQDNGNDAKN